MCGLDTIIDVRRRTQELTGSEIVAREIDPGYLLLLINLIFLAPTEHRECLRIVPIRAQSIVG